MKPILSILLVVISIYAKGQINPADNVLFNAFKQGSVNGGGNCASIALIKACIGTYGVGNVFSYGIPKTDNSITVKLKNDSTFDVTFKEIAEATRGNGFVIKSTNLQAGAIKKYADTCFAIMVKVNEKVWEYDSYTESLSALLNGYNTPNVYLLLGVRFREISKDSLNDYSHLLFYNSYHAVYSSNGYYDETKSSKGYSLNSNFDNNRFGIKCSWYGCKPRKVFIIDR